MQFLLRQSCNLKMARVNQVRFSVRFVAAISQGFRACLKLDATKIASSCCDKNRLFKRALSALDAMYRVRKSKSKIKFFYRLFMELFCHFILALGLNTCFKAVSIVSISIAKYAEEI